MGVPQVVILGRPNVGKSSLFNWIAGKRLAIVDPTAGVTRDRVTHLVELHERFIEIVDTGGMGIADPDNLTESVEEQIETAIDSAAVILLVVDTRDGLTPLDEEVARRLRYVNVPVLCVANKTDTREMEPQAEEFYRMGRKVIAVSAQQNRGKDALVAAIAEKLPPAAEGEGPAAEPTMKVAIVGRQNTGKSTFVNTLARAERMIVSEVPGTTRDSVDVRFELDGQAFLAIDTPGVRRKTSIATNIDFYSAKRAERSIRRADVVLLFFDASQRLTKVDKQLCDYIAQQYKPCIFVVNKWDLVGSMPRQKWVALLRDTFRTMPYVSIAFVIGQAGKNVKALLNHAQTLFKQSRARATTGQLNKVLEAALEHSPPPLSGTKQPKIYYGTQVATQPPTIVLFCNDPSLLSAQYQRYLLSTFRDHLEYGEIPIKLYLRRREGGRSGKDGDQQQDDQPESSEVSR